MRALIGLTLVLSLCCVPAAADDEGAERIDALTAAMKEARALMFEAARLEEKGRREEALEAYRAVRKIIERALQRDGGVLVVLGKMPDVPRKHQQPVAQALTWLKACQSSNGGWEAAGYWKWGANKPSGRKQPDEQLGNAHYDVGVTGLAVCAFLSAGYTNRGKHPFKTTVSRGLRYLKNVQDAEGCFGSRGSGGYVYNHAWATLAMVRAYAMTHSPIFHGAAQRALAFSEKARNPNLAWRYGVKPGDNDSSVTTAMLMDLHEARGVNERHKVWRGELSPLENGVVGKQWFKPLEVDDASFAGARAWVERITDPDYGRGGYITRGSGPARCRDNVDVYPGEKSEAPTAMALLLRLWTGEDTQSELMQKGASLCANLPPLWDPKGGSIDLIYWYYGTLALREVGGSAWETWLPALEKALVPAQRTDGVDKGSWDPIGAWGYEGGRVYATAIAAMTLCNADRPAK